MAASGLGKGDPLSMALGDLIEIDEDDEDRLGPNIQRSRRTLSDTNKRPNLRINMKPRKHLREAAFFTKISHLSIKKINTTLSTIYEEPSNTELENKELALSNLQLGPAQDMIQRRRKMIEKFFGKTAFRYKNLIPLNTFIRLIDDDNKLDESELTGNEAAGGFTDK